MRRIINISDAYYRDGNKDLMYDLIAGYVNERIDEYLRILSICDDKLDNYYSKLK